MNITECHKPALQSRFSAVTCSDINANDDEDDFDEGLDEDEVEEQWSQFETGRVSPRESSTNTVASGVLLQPKNLAEDRAPQLYR